MCFLILQPYVYMKHIYICSHEAHTFVYLFPLSLCLFFIFLSLLPRLPRWLSGKEPTCSAIVYHWIKIPRFHPWVREIPWRTEWQPTPVFLPGESHGQRSLVASRLEGHKSQTQLSSRPHGQHGQHRTTLSTRLCFQSIIPLGEVPCFYPSLHPIIKNDGIYEHLLHFYGFISYHLLLFHCKQF